MARLFLNVARRAAQNPLKLIRNFPKKRRESRIVKVIANRNLFSVSFYLASYPDVATSELAPLFHYVRYGATEGRDPSADFSTRHYLSTYPDVASSGFNPLYHYIVYGMAEGRTPKPCGAPALTERTLTAPTLATPVREWRDGDPDLWPTVFAARLKTRLRALDTAVLEPCFPGELTFSLMTAVHDAPPNYLRAMADSVRDQAYSEYEWLLLDNGSTDDETIACCLDIARENKRVRYFRLENHLHIIECNRYLLDRASGRYIASTDHDHILYPDSLALLADVLRKEKSDPPEIIYSDEHQIDHAGVPVNLIWRWQLSLSQALASMPAAHMIAIDRRKAREADLYSDDYAKGSHNWDSVLRMLERGGRAVHVPEVLYGWRVHSGSTAGSSDTKDCIALSQIAVVEASLRRMGVIHKFGVESTFNGAVGWHRISRRPGAPAAPFLVDLVWTDEASSGFWRENLEMTDGTVGPRRALYPKSRESEVRESLCGRTIDMVAYADAEELGALLSEVSDGVTAKFVVGSNVRIASKDAIDGAMAVFETNPLAGIVGGPLFSEEDITLSLGLVAGLEGFLASPFFGWRRQDLPRHISEVNRSTDAVPAQFIGVRAETLRQGLRFSSLDIADGLQGVALCIQARRLGYEVIYSWDMQAVAAANLPKRIAPSADLRRDLIEAAGSGAFDWKLAADLTRDADAFGHLARFGESPALPLDMSRLAPAIPLNLSVSPRLARRPTLNLLLPGIRMISMSGGPNTALNLAYRLAAEGFPVRLVSTDVPVDEDPVPTWKHVMEISGVGRRLKNVQIIDASNRNLPFEIGANDVFLATAWWTAQMVKAATPLISARPFVYLIQDYEPIFYPHSSNYALASETYGLDSIPVLNSFLLRDFLIENRIGLFSNPKFSREALAFEPAVSRADFYPDAAVVPRSSNKHRLLFYARPETGIRNMFELGVTALKKLVADGDLNGRYWDVIGIGDKFEPIPLGEGTMLQCGPWLGFDAYAEQMRSSDVLLSLMLSPHPSYPPLEMAASGGLVVTNTYANKTVERLSAYSSNIIAAEATVEALAAALRQAVLLASNRTTREAGADIALPSTWDESFEPIFQPLIAKLEALGLQRNLEAAGDPVDCELPKDGDTPAYTAFLKASAEDRANRYPAMPEAGLISFVTAVWNTPLPYLEVLAESVDLQTKDMPIEWYIVDNGSTRRDVAAFLDRLAAEKAYVTLERSPENHGIVGGMRLCLKGATGRYILPVDHDDCLDPGCARTVAWTLQKHDYPPLLYTDEDKVFGEVRSGPYLKPDWDPVLFVNSCYTSHLCALDRRIALELDAYTDRTCEGSPDWDVVTRFFNAGHLPLHVPEVLYSWRMHPQSTSMDMDSKPVVFDSQRAVIERFRKAQPNGGRFDLVKSPLFGRTPDWWLKRRRDIAVPPVTTLLLRTAGDTTKVAPPVPVKGVDHKVVDLPVADDLEGLLREARKCVAAGRRVHLMSAILRPDPDEGEWLYEASGLFELFPDTVMVGGRLHAGGGIIGAGYVFGNRGGFGCPDRSRLLTDPGYSMQLWKPHSVQAVSPQNVVIDAAFLVEALEACANQDPTYVLLGGWLGAWAARRSGRVIYTPFISAVPARDWDELADKAELGRLLSFAGPLNEDRRLWSPHLSLNTPYPYSPGRDVAACGLTATRLSSYDDWRRRLPIVTCKPSTTGFSLLTTLYIGTDPQLFLATVNSVRAQTHRAFEWVILTHGPIQPELERCLTQLQTNEPRVRRMTLAENVGIIRGMRRVLEIAREDYILPMDGDDLLAPDTLAILADRIDATSTRPAMLYTDEDIVIGDDLQSPYLRPAWDPVLDLENSWIWHACAFRRDLAMELGVYLAEGSEYCHDWDTAHRFTAAGHIPVHVPTLAYHWRHHARSTSGAAVGGASGSSLSVQSLLAEKIKAQGLEGRYEVARFPIDRGAEEWWIKATPGAPGPAMARVRLSASVNWRELLAEAAAKSDAGAAIWLESRSAILLNPNLAHGEAAKLFDFLPDVGVVCGRLRRGTQVAMAGWMADEDGRLSAPYDGMAASDGGPYALAWKPQSIAAGAPDVCAVRATVLKAAVEAAPVDCAVSEFGLWLGSFLAAQGGRVAYSPLIEAELTGLPLGVRHASDANTIWRHFSKAGGAAPTGRQGAGGYGGAGVGTTWRS